MKTPELSSLALAGLLLNSSCQSGPDTQHPESVEAIGDAEVNVSATSNVSTTRSATKEITSTSGPTTQPDNLANLNTRLRLMGCIGNAPMGTPGLMIKSTGRQFNFLDQGKNVSVNMEGGSNGNEQLILSAKVNDQPAPATESLLVKGAIECEEAVKKSSTTPNPPKDTQPNGSWKSKTEDQIDTNFDIDLGGARIEGNINTLLSFGSNDQQDELADCTVDKKRTRENHGEFCIDDTFIKTCVTVDQTQTGTADDRTVYQKMEIKVRPSAQLGKKTIPKQDIVLPALDECKK